ncbi:MAG: hypothetical protein LBF97_06600 [Elusimicrobiota bacterium]|jgi:hypothetical protein|nr:hypothetical protein [Elusimicrobiota bacterium]
MIYKTIKNQNKDKHYLDIILEKSQGYMENYFPKKDYILFINKIEYIYNIKNTQEIVKNFCKTYCDFVKFLYQRDYKYDKKIDLFLNENHKKK